MAMPGATQVRFRHEDSSGSRCGGRARHGAAQPWAGHVPAVIGAALVALPSVARAQGGLTGRLRYQGGYTHEPRRCSARSVILAGVVPQLSYLVAERRWLIRTTYAFTANVHTRNPTEIGRPTLVPVLVRSTSPGERRVLLSADANQTSLSNYLLTHQGLRAPPSWCRRASNSRFLTVSASQGLTWEVSPRGDVRTGVRHDVRDLAGPRHHGIRNSFTNALLSLERTWKRDGLGCRATRRVRERLHATQRGGEVRDPHGRAALAS